MDVNRFTAFLGGYPVTSVCLSDYVRWLGDNPTIDLEHNDLISVLQAEDVECLEKLEYLLCRAREIIGLSEKDFKASFGFSTDLHSRDPDKIHDVLAEPVVVVSLADNGFHAIRKLPRFIKHEGHRLPAADFTAERAGKKFAIELKTIRMENKPRPQTGKLTGNAMIPSWWRDMFRNNTKTKIEDKNRKVLAQLANTKRHLMCHFAMLALYNRRIGPSTLMATQDYHDELRLILGKYPELDYIFFKDYFGEVVVCPELSST
jgi:hypothetical protein